MKLFDKSKQNCIVYAIVAKAAKEGTAPTYQAFSGNNSLEDCEKTITDRGSRNAYPYPLGKYDEFGRYMTYCPPVEGIALGKFVLHPLAEQERKREEAFS